MREFSEPIPIDQQDFDYGQAFGVARCDPIWRTASHAIFCGHQRGVCVRNIRREASNPCPGNAEGISVPLFLFDLGFVRAGGAMGGAMQSVIGGRVNLVGEG